MSNVNEAVMTNDALSIWVAKAAGAVAGSAVSLAYMLPNGKREAAARFAVGVICGAIFGGAAGVKIAEVMALGEALGRSELMLMGSAAASLAAWTALGVFNRFAERLKQASLPGILPQERSDRNNG
ncbi:DUF6107 family protein [Daeguia caeni]|uniref:DUF6107 family protein n=1 Tax=Daeguia caeni TaxID=439612 RepID=A0ABV9H884_9HYPH